MAAGRQANAHGDEEDTKRHVLVLARSVILEHRPAALYSFRRQAPYRWLTAPIVGREHEFVLKVAVALRGRTLFTCEWTLSEVLRDMRGSWRTLRGQLESISSTPQLPAVAARLVRYLRRCEEHMDDDERLVSDDSDRSKSTVPYPTDDDDA